MDEEIASQSSQPVAGTSTFPTSPRPPTASSDASPKTSSLSSSKDEPPSLTLSIISAWQFTTWIQRIPALLATVMLNFGLPFINGLALGFGEIFAREYLGVKLGYLPPLSARNGKQAPGRATTASVGLRGSAGSRTAADAVVKEGELLTGLVKPVG